MVIYCAGFPAIYGTASLFSGQDVRGARGDPCTQTQRFTDQTSRAGGPNCLILPLFLARVNNKGKGHWLKGQRRNDPGVSGVD